jgi:WD40 repeat protein
VIGIWSGTMDGSDVNAVALSPSKRLLATADDFGSVNLFLFPSIQDKGAAHNSYSGHSSHVTNVQWASTPSSKKKSSANEPFQVPKTDDYLISTGGEDKCIFQWRHRIERGPRESIKLQIADDNDDDAPAKVSEDDTWDIPSGGDEFLAVKPWVGAIVAPTAWTSPDPTRLPPFFSALGEYARMHTVLADSIEKDRSTGKATTDTALYSSLSTVADLVLQTISESGYVDHSAPSHDELELEWVHGIRAFDSNSRNNVFYAWKANSPFGDRFVLYCAASLCVCFSPKLKEQRYFRGHTDDVVALTICNSRNRDNTLVASAQQGPAKIFVWSAPDMQTLSVMQPKQKNVLQLSFSGDDGRLLVSIAQDGSISVLDWQSNTTLVDSKSDSATVNAMCVLSPSSLTGNSLHFLAVANKSLRLYVLNGRNISSNKLVLSTCKDAKLQAFLSTVELCGKIFIGCEDGDVYISSIGSKGIELILKAKKSKGVEKKFSNSITAMHCNEQLCLLLCGTKNGLISIYDCSKMSQGGAANVLPTLVYSFNITDVGVPNILAKQIQSIAVLASTTAESISVAIATRGCDLLEVNVSLSDHSATLQKQDSNCDGVLTRGHCNDELWGIATHPKLPEFCTVGRSTFGSSGRVGRFVF